MPTLQGFEISDKTEARAVIDSQLQATWAAHRSDEEAAVVLAVMNRINDHVKKDK